MIGIRWILVPLAALVLTSGTGAGGPGAFAKKPKSEAQVKRLIETVRTDPDEKRRRAALAELQDADPRAHPDVISALIAVLQKDASAQIRGEAAEAIGQFKIVYPVAGLSLEAAAELDPSKAVRENAQQALWEYHLAGYRSLRGSGGIVGQTAEPPLARPASRPAVAPAAGGGGPTTSIQSPASPRPVGELPSFAVQPPVSSPLPMTRGPAISLRPTFSLIAILRPSVPTVTASKGSETGPPPQLNLTPEPPLAKARVFAIAPAPICLEVQTVSREGDPFQLPPISEPPGEPPEAQPTAPASLLRSGFEPLPPGPRVRLPLR